ncbi:hypothetical protein QFC20_004058 [Naganishia adeliensis]|uniref:Uncharacterized protein n=1 Tax=Naganishia adeliensis TaxID=92952 RepID=A0ACC2W584_9TREE|nr:hypothetical protein QFC20_004058 [Naganishia adeliensis]
MAPTTSSMTSITMGLQRRTVPSLKDGIPSRDTAQTWTSITPDIWINGGANVTDEWTFCQTVGKERCGPLLEDHYANFITNATIDKLATVDVNTVRIPTIYAAWVDVPGSKLYRGDQLKYLREVTDYAISTYGMHVIIDLHSLPGGVNSLEIGEAFGHSYWWYNLTNFDYSLQAIDGVLDFIQSSAAPNQFTIAPINEPCESIANFATPQSVSYPDGTNYVTAYMKAVYAKMQAVNPNLWLMQNDGFAGASRWTPYWNTTDKWMLDVHVYYFPVEGVQGASIPGLICQEAIGRRADGFNVFVGEFSLQALLNNTLNGRQAAYESQVRAFQQYLSGGTFWTARFDGYRPVNGEGTQNDCWGLSKLLDEGMPSILLV